MNLESGRCLLEIYTCGIRNPRLWNPKYSSVNPESHQKLEFADRNPSSTGKDLEFSTWNSESMAWNPKTKSILDSLPWGDRSLGIGTLSSNNVDVQRERHKTIGLMSKTTTSHVHHTFLYISFPFLHDYDVKMPNFAFYGGRKQATTKFYFSF